MSSWKIIVGVSASSILLGALGLYGVRAIAEGAPTTQPLFYSGTVADKDGTPLEGKHSLSVALYTGQTGGEAVCATPTLAVELESGRFRVELNSGERGCREAVASNPDTWVELTVDANTFPRAKVGAVPYALEADHAKQATVVTGAQADKLDKLQKAVDALAAPTLKVRFISLDAGCDWNPNTNSTVCMCEPGEIITAVGGFAGYDAFIQASRHQVGPDFANGNEADRARMWTMSCATATGEPRQCEAVQATCIKL